MRIYILMLTKMKRELRQKLLYKREFERTRKEKLARDIVCY